MNRISSLLIITFLCIHSISAQEGSGSPYAQFGDNTFTLDIEHRKQNDSWSILVIQADSLFALMSINGDSIHIKDMAGNIISSRKADQTAHAIFSAIDPKTDEMPWVSPYAFCFGNPIRFVDKNGERPSGFEAFLMAWVAYKEDNKETNNYIKTLKELGWTVSTHKTSINMDLTKWYQNGLQSMLFERTIDGKTEYVYAFAGTISIEDGLEDIAQLTGCAPQYYSAINNAKTLYTELKGAELKGAELTFVGHSLGGGEAAASSMATGCAAITFNPAAVSPATRFFGNLGSDANITNYIIIPEGTGNIRLGGCFVNNFQNNIGMPAPGKRIYVPVKSKDPFSSHKLKSFKPYFNL